MTLARKSLPRKWPLFFKALRQATADTPGDQLTAIRALPPAGALPSPWEAWLLLSLFEYREQQLWARKLLRERMPAAVPPCDRLWSRDQPIEGHLPGSPEWELSLECTEPPYAVMHHKVTGEYTVVDISTLGKTCPLVFLNSYPRDSPKLSETSATARLRGLCSWFDRDVRLRDIHAEGSLVRSGLLDEVYCDPDEELRNIEPEAHRLSRLAVRHSALVRQFLRDWQRTANRLWLAALIGDWLLADKLAQEQGDQDLIAVTAQRAQACREQRLKVIRRAAGSGPACTAHLLALHSCGADDLTVYLQRGLADGWGRGEAAYFLEECDEPTWCETVFDWLQNGRCGSEKSGCERTLVKYLVRHGYKAAAPLQLLTEDYCEPEHASLIALQFVPNLALPHVRTALRSHLHSAEDDPASAVYQKSPMCEVAIALAIVGMPWCVRELMAAVRELESDAWPNRGNALPLILALSESCNPEAADAVNRWEHLYGVEEYRECQKHFRDRMEWEKARLPWLLSVVSVGS